MHTARSIAIVGVDFPNKRGPARRFELEICQPGETIELRPEPKNEFDEHAIAVFSCRGIQLGYLPSERAVLIGTLMRQGHDVAAIFQALGPTCGWVRVAFDGEQPVLPPMIAAAERGEQGCEDDPGFWPDPIYDD